VTNFHHQVVFSSLTSINDNLVAAIIISGAPKGVIGDGNDLVTLTF
jgi:hypothetical protein